MDAETKNPDKIVNAVYDQYSTRVSIVMPPMVFGRVRVCYGLSWGHERQCTVPSGLAEALRRWGDDFAALLRERDSLEDALEEQRSENRKLRAKNHNLSLHLESHRAYDAYMNLFQDAENQGYQFRKWMKDIAFNLVNSPQTITTFQHHPTTGLSEIVVSDSVSDDFVYTIGVCYVIVAKKVTYEGKEYVCSRHVDRLQPVNDNSIVETLCEVGRAKKFLTEQMAQKLNMVK